MNLNIYVSISISHYIYKHKNVLKLFGYCLQAFNFALAPGPHKSYTFAPGNLLPVLF